jgi:Tfp pilus assembly protein PilF
MTSDRWARIREIFAEAIDYAGEARLDFVRGACNGDDSFKREIFDLLRAHERPSAVVDRQILPAGLVQDAANPHTFREGQLVSGRFRILHFLGEGGMGEVYAAEDQELHIQVALKTLHAPLAASPKFAKRFRQEIQLARQVTHPNVCRIFDAGRHEGTPYFTMELLEGETLARRLERSGPMNVGEAEPIVRQLCDALSAAHRAGVSHRDFKSANVMLVGTRAVVTDFGLARLLNADVLGAATTGVAVGTPAYMAPEQIEGVASGPSVDIYALGVVMYEMVTGARPYRQSSPLAMAAAKLNEPPPSPRSFAEVTAEWEAVILKCLSAQPEQRFADAQQVIAALEGAAPLNIRRRLPGKKISLAIATCVFMLAGTAGLNSLVVGRSRAVASPADAVRWYRQGTDALAERSFLKAANLFERAISLEDGFIAAHARLAEAYAELDMSDKAKDEIIRAVTLAPDRSKLPESDARLLTAAQFMVAREFSNAEQAYRAIAENAPPADKGRVYLDVGRAAEKANRTANAIGAYRIALESSPQREVALLHLGKLSARQGKRTEATAQLSEAAQLFQLASNFEGVTEAKLELARMYQNFNLTEAESQTQSAIEMAALTGNVQQQVRSRFEMSRIKLLQGHADKAAATAEEAIGLAERLHLENLSVQGLNDLAAIMSRQLKWPEVEALCRRAVALAKRSRSRGGEARALLYLAQARMDQDDNQGALQHLEQALPFYREGGDSVALQDALAIKSDLLCAQGRYSEARDDAAEMIEWGETRQDDQTLILGLQRAAEPRVFEGDYAGALALYERETELEKKSGRLAGTVYALINQADMLWRLGRYSESAVRLSEAQAALTELGDDARGPRERLDLVQADSFLSQLRTREAAVKAKQALASAQGGITSRVIAAQALHGLALVQRGDIAAGREWCARSLRAAEEGGNPAWISLAKLAAAEAALLADNPEAGKLAADAREHCLRFGQRELALRALLLQWNFEQRFGEIPRMRELAVTFARESAGLEKFWGTGLLAAYLQRPDIRRLIPPK